MRLAVLPLLLLPASLPAAWGRSAPAAGGTRQTGAACVKYALTVPAGLLLSTPARDSAAQFTEFAAERRAGEGRPFRFEARITRLDESAGCDPFTRYIAGLDETFRADGFNDLSPAALQSAGGAKFRARVWHKEIPADFNGKSAALNVHAWATTQGQFVLTLVFYTDARDEADGLALKTAILNSLTLGPGSGAGVCLPAAPRAASGANSR